MKARTSFLEREALTSATDDGFQPYHMVTGEFAGSRIVSEFRRRIEFRRFFESLVLAGTRCWH